MRNWIPDVPSMTPSGNGGSQERVQAHVRTAYPYRVPITSPNTPSLSHSTQFFTLLSLCGLHWDRYIKEIEMARLYFVNCFGLNSQAVDQVTYREGRANRRENRREE